MSSGVSPHRSLQSLRCERAKNNNNNNTKKRNRMLCSCLAADYCDLNAFRVGK